MSHSQACLLRGVLNVEEFSRRGKDGMTMRYQAAMNSFEHDWRELLLAIESGDVVCEASEKEELLDLQTRFAHFTSKHYAHYLDRSEQRVRAARAFLYHSFKDATRSSMSEIASNCSSIWRVVDWIGRTTCSRFMRW